MSWIPMALQVLPLIPGLLDSGIRIANAIMDDPAVSDEDKKAMLQELTELNARLSSLVDRVKASKFPDFNAPKQP